MDVNVTDVIPTNVISITDLIRPDLFNAGIRPAINVGSYVEFPQ